MAISVNNDILCRINGVVSPDYVCSKHRFMPVSKVTKAINYKCSDCEFFIPASVDTEADECIGCCQLFTVRQYNGSEKNACSKFSKRSQLEVS